MIRRTVVKQLHVRTVVSFNNVAAAAVCEKPDGFLDGAKNTTLKHF